MNDKAIEAAHRILMSASEKTDFFPSMTLVRAAIAAYEQAKPRDDTEADIGKWIVGLYKCLLKKAEDKQ